MLPGREGILYRLKHYLDILGYSEILLSLGKDVVIHPSVDIRNPENVRIGSYCSINHGSEIHGAGGVTIGDGVLIAYGVKIFSDMREFQNRGLIGKQRKIKKKVHIGDDVWIGAGVIILPGVIINDHAVVGAGAVVSKDVGEWEIVGGNPTKRIGSRLDHETGSEVK
jgi:maltose O-acetyltransferase